MGTLATVKYNTGVPLYSGGMLRGYIDVEKIECYLETPVHFDRPVRG